VEREAIKEKSRNGMKVGQAGERKVLGLRKPFQMGGGQFFGTNSLNLGKRKQRKSNWS